MVGRERLTAPDLAFHASIESRRSLLYHPVHEDEPMPDDDDDQHIVLNFQPRPKPRPGTGRKPPTHLQTDPEDLIAGGAVIAALILAVALVSGWVPADRYAVGVFACLAAVAIAAKLIRARRSKASVTDLPRQRR
jgi:hypothetical protein